MIDFNRYFHPASGITLDNLNYESGKIAVPDQKSAAIRLGCKDTILAQIGRDGIKINLNRALSFEPEGPFSMSVT